MVIDELTFDSRRSDVHGTRGMVATSQPLAVMTGLDVLREGGNAADAAIAAAAMLCVVEPVSTGLGGDCFALVRRADTGRVEALNGSGRSPAGASLAEIRRLMYSRMPRFTGHAVTVPGAVAGWCDLLSRHGTMSLERVLAPAIRAAEEGYPVTRIIAHGWARQVEKLLRAPGWQSGDFTNGPPQASGAELLLDGRAPRAGELLRLPTLARTLRCVAEGGRGAFYSGEFARKLSDHVQAYGGWMTPADLAAHESEWVEPISAGYRGVRLFECPPNGQGLAALIAARLADGFDLPSASEADRQHLLIECMRLAFADGLARIADPRSAPVDVEGALSDGYSDRRRAEIRPDRSIRFPQAGLLPTGDDTVYLGAVDADGMAVSFIQSLYMGTGTGLVVPGTGVSLQNRGAGFSLDPEHPNALAPGKRPYHTIVPALTTRDGELQACFGVMGGYMQPQAHLQVLSNLLDRGMGPQAALDAPRWQITGEDPGRSAPTPGGPVLVEEGFSGETLLALSERGHRLRRVSGYERVLMGGGQVILRDPESGVLSGGSDPRKDGCAAAL